MTNKKTFCLGFIIGIFIFTGSVGAATIYVNHSNNGAETGISWDAGWNTIQEGIDNAISGDTVSIINGTYTENIIINKPINIIGKEKMLINGSIHVNRTNGVNITRLIIKGNTLNNGIHIDHSNNTRIDDVNITKSGKGILINNSNSVNISSVHITHVDFGIIVQFSNGTSITNTITSLASGNASILNGTTGILLYRCYETMIINITTDGSMHSGIHIRESYNNSVYNSNIPNYGMYGISIEKSILTNIIGNTIRFATIGGIQIRIANQSRIVNNIIINNHYGVYSDLYKGGYNNTISYNIIMNNTYGVNISSRRTSYSSAIYNYWGSTDGPSSVGIGTGDSISINLTHIPFLRNNRSVDKAITRNTSNSVGILDIREELNIKIEYNVTAALNITISRPSVYFRRDYPINLVTPDISLGYVSIDVSNISNINNMVVNYYYTEEDIIGLSELFFNVSWYNNITSKYEKCYNVSMNTTNHGNYSGYVSIHLNTTTNPSIGKLDAAFHIGTIILPLPIIIQNPSSSSGFSVKINISEIRVPVVETPILITSGKTIKLTITLSSGRYERSGAMMKLTGIPAGWVAPDVWTGVLNAGINNKEMFLTIPMGTMGNFNFTLEVIPKDFYGKSQKLVSIKVEPEVVIRNEEVVFVEESKSTPVLTDSPVLVKNKVVPSPTPLAKEKGICGPTLVLVFIILPVIIKRRNKQ